MQKRRTYHDQNRRRENAPAGAWTIQTNGQGDRKQHDKEQDDKNMTAATFRVCRFRIDDSCQLSAVHAHQITQYMKNMIGVTSIRVHGQDIYVSYVPEEASDHQVKNYLCAAACLFGPKWRDAIQRAFHHRYGKNEAAA